MSKSTCWSQLVYSQHLLHASDGAADNLNHPSLMSLSGQPGYGARSTICSQQGPSSWRPVSTPLLHALPLRAAAEAVAVMSLWRRACGPLLLKVCAFWGNFFIFFTSKKRNTCSGYFHLQPVQLEEEDGTNIHSMCNRISKLNHGLSVILLKEYNKYLFRGNGNVSREDKYKK